MQKLEYIVKQKDINKTINEILKTELKISTRLLSKLINLQKISLNDKPIDTRNNVNINDIITIDLSYDETSSNIVSTKMSLDIIYEDEWMLVVNKPAGIPIHPSRMHFTNSLSNGVKSYFESIGLKKKIRPINRLDLDTSGVVIFAKCEYIQEAFIQQMEKQLFTKIYLCLITGHLEKCSGTINLPISRKTGSIIERCINTNGQKSITHYNVKKEYDNYSLVECRLETGRTHQIRVHMSSIGHSLLGDTLYGSSSKLISRQALHSYKIECLHPITKNKLTFIAKLPLDIAQLVSLVS